MLPDEDKENLETIENEPETGGDNQPNPGDDADPAPAKPDWRVQKYGEDYETKADYWKDTASYWRGETQKEKNKRQSQRSSLEDLDKAPPVAKTNGNGNGNGDHAETKSDAKATDQEIATVKELLDHVNKNNEDFFEKKFSERLTEHQKESNFKSSMQKARSEYSGDVKNGIPSFADLEQEVLVPLVQKNPKILALLREMDGDPGQNAYTLGMLVKFQGGFFEKLRGQGREELADKIENVSKEAVRVKAGKSGPTSVKLSPEDIKSMSSADFEKLVAQNTGRA